MEPQATPEFFISPMRVQTLPEISLFYIAGKPVPFADLDKDFDALLDSLEAAKAQAHLDQAAPNITRYYKVGGSEPGLFLMEAGTLVKPGTQPAGAAQVKKLAPFHCAGLLLWGGLTHIGAAYEALQKAIDEAGLAPTGENEEWTYYFEAVDSPHNLMALYIGVKGKA
jgi:hypothetical protein